MPHLAGHIKRIDAAAQLVAGIGVPGVVQRSVANSSPGQDRFPAAGQLFIAAERLQGSPAAKHVQSPEPGNALLPLEGLQGARRSLLLT